jgi:anti-repressor protein
MYATPDTVDKLLSDPDTAILMLQRYKEERDKRQALEAQAEKNAPKVLFADSVAASKQTILVGELAKLLNQNGIDIGQNRLFESLRKDGYLCGSVGERWNQPTQYSMDLGLFRIKERTINNPDGSVRLTRTTLVTGKGQQYFISRYLGRKEA